MSPQSQAKHDCKISRDLIQCPFSRHLARLAFLLSSLLMMPSALAESVNANTEPSPTEANALGIALKSSKALEIGLHRSSLSAGNPSWSGGFVKGSWWRDSRLLMMGEISSQKRYGDHGTYVSLGATRIINDDWYGSMFVASGMDGFFLPEFRLDAFISRKWLSRRQLITTAGISHIRAKDEHRDLSLFLGSSYYFAGPWILEGGLHHNRSDPGDVTANSAYLALTYGEAGDQYLILRHSAGREAYQLIGPNADISDFSSRNSSLVWRKWLAPRMGFTLRLEHYSNPYYERNSLELSNFQNF